MDAERYGGRIPPPSVIGKREVLPSDNSYSEQPQQEEEEVEEGGRRGGFGSRRIGAAHHAHRLAMLALKPLVPTYAVWSYT